jgi:putative transposase
MKIFISTGNRFEIIHDMAGRGGSLLKVSTLCDLAGVSRSGYYHWLSQEEARTQREERDRANFELIVEAYRYRGFDKGGRGIYMRLLRHDPPVIMNLKKIRRLMTKYGLKCPIRKANPYRRMVKALQTNNVSPNLLERRFREGGMRRVLLTDISYIISPQAPRCYLSTIIDAYTKEVLAYIVSPSLEVDFVLETVQMLIRNQGESLLEAETLIHSDQGFHYTSVKFIQIVKDNNLRQSMSRRANCWDNAPQESFFGHMKDEIDISKCKTVDQIRAVIDDWIDYYNNERYQWELAKLAPREFAEYTITGVYPLEGIVREPVNE